MTRIRVLLGMVFFMALSFGEVICRSKIMNDTLASIFFLLLGLTPFLLKIELITNKPAWWIVRVTIIVVGWSLVVGAYIFCHLWVGDLITRGKRGVA